MYLKPEKGTPFRGSFSVLAIIVPCTDNSAWYSDYFRRAVTSNVQDFTPFYR